MPHRTGTPLVFLSLLDLNSYDVLDFSHGFHIDLFVSIFRGSGRSRLEEAAFALSVGAYLSPCITQLHSVPWYGTLGAAMPMLGSNKHAQLIMLNVHASAIPTVQHLHPRAPWYEANLELVCLSLQEENSH